MNRLQTLLSHFLLDVISGLPGNPAINRTRGGQGGYSVDWYIDVPDVPPIRKPPTAEELAALEAAKAKTSKKKK